MKKIALILICALLFACSKDVTEGTLDNVTENPFKSPQIFMVIEEGKIDSIIQDISLDSKKLLTKGIKKRVVTKKIDPMKGIYARKYITYSNMSPTTPMSIYTNDTLNTETVIVSMQKYTQSNTVNCTVNNKPCWCSYR